MTRTESKKSRAAEALTRIAVWRRVEKPGGPLWALLVVSALLLLTAVAQPAFVSSSGDALLRVAATIDGRKATPEIVIAAIDDRSIHELGSWPWPRRTFIGFLEKLRRMKPGLVVVDARTASDVGLSDLKLPGRGGGPDYVVGYKFYTTLASLPADRDAAAGEREIKEAADRLAFPSTPADDAPLPAMAGIRMNRFAVADRPYIREGFANLFPDPDGVVRRAPLAARLRHRVYPSLALVAAAAWRGFTPILAQDPAGQPSGATMGRQRISTGPDGTIAINYRGGDSSFERISAADISADRASQDEIDSRLVVVGPVSPMLGASHETPMGKMPDVEILANALDNILLDRTLTDFSGRAAGALAVLAIALLYALCISRISAKLQLAATALIFLSLSAAGAASAALWKLRLPVTEPAFASIALYLTIVVHRLIKYEVPRFLLRRSWRNRIGDDDIDAIAKGRRGLAGTAKAVPVTVLAIDIRGFSAIVERLAPTQLVEFLKDYRSVVTESCTANGGFIESLSGDECTAVFGAPVKRSDHAIRAIESAVCIRRRLTGMREELEARFGTGRLKVGIGIQTGVAASGNSGSWGAGYGVAGAAIEAASQLRAMNRVYRTSTLVGDPTRAATEAGYSYRELDPVMLRGEGGACLVHELIGEMGTIMPQLGAFLEAREAYLVGDFQRAAGLFAGLLEAHPNDGPSKLFFRRSLYLSEHPPEKKWRGIWGR